MESIGHHDIVGIKVSMIDSFAVDEVDGFKDLKQYDLPLKSYPFLVFLTL